MLTKEQFDALTPEEVRIKIAEIAGWTKCRLAIKGPGGGTRHPTAHGVPPKRGYEASCPNYLRSLDAIAAVEAMLTGEQHEQFRAMLCVTIGQKEVIHGQDDPYATASENERKYVSATPAQRCEALLRAI